MTSTSSRHHHRRSRFDYAALMAVTELGSNFNWMSARPFRPVSPIHNYPFIISYVVGHRIEPSFPFITVPPSSCPSERGVVSIFQAASRHNPDWWSCCCSSCWWCNGRMLHLMMNTADGGGPCYEALNERHFAAKVIGLVTWFNSSSSSRPPPPPV